MPWLQLIIPSSDTKAEQLSDALMAQGAASVTLQDMQDEPVLEPTLGSTPMWSQTRAIALFDASEDLKQIVKNLEAQLQQPIPNWKIEQLEDKDWTRAWMDDFKPMPFGEKLWVVPSTFKAPEPKATNIILDPGLAFGTGTHPTTAMCLQWLDAHSPANKNVLDFGCGSGILAIAAILLGAKHANAVDLDPQALIATRDNAQKNNVADHITTYLPGDFAAQQTELLLANILASPLIALASYFADMCVSGGKIVLSGILNTQADQVCAAYQDQFDIAIWQQKDDWICLAGTKS